MPVLTIEVERLISKSISKMEVIIGEEEANGIKAALRMGDKGEKKFGIITIKVEEKDTGSEFSKAYVPRKKK